MDADPEEGMMMGQDGMQDGWLMTIIFYNANIIFKITLILYQ